MSLRWRSNCGSDDASAETTRAFMVDQDANFCAAMQAAAQRGDEHPPMVMGVYRDTRPIGRVTEIPFIPASSGCGSPAALAADEGSRRPPRRPRKAVFAPPPYR